MMINKQINFMAMVILVLFVSACDMIENDDNYGAGQLNQMIDQYTAEIIDAREVKAIVQRKHGKTIGTVAGAALGAGVGAGAASKGNKGMGAVIGGGLGGLGGRAIGSIKTKKSAIEYTLMLENGKQKVITRQGPQQFAIGDIVDVTMTSGGVKMKISNKLFEYSNKFDRSPVHHQPPAAPQPQIHVHHQPPAASQPQIHVHHQPPAASQPQIHVH